jgi:subtilisin family serine protease
VREKLNSDPRYQIGAVILLVLVAVVMLTKGGGGSESSEEAAPTEATVSVAGTGASATATGATPGEAVESAVEGAVEAVGTEISAAVPQVPTPPLPAPVAAAYDSGKTVVLVIANKGGIDKRLVAVTTRQVAGFSEAVLFVVPAKQVARYGAITIGTEVQRVPALLVMRPRNLSGGTPQASVSYGFQSAQAVDQAIRDASYHGPEATYNPN